MMETSVAYPNFLDYRDQNTVFEQIAVFRRDSFNLTGNAGSRSDFPEEWFLTSSKLFEFNPSLAVISLRKKIIQEEIL